MSDKPQLKHTDLERVARGLGFVFKVQVGSHMQYKHPATGKKVTIAKYNHPYGEDLVSSMARQMGIEKKELYKRARK